MSRVIKADRDHARHGVVFNYDDVAAQARDCLDKARMEAAGILSKAKEEATGIRTKAEADGLRAAEATMNARLREGVEGHFATLSPAIHSAIAALSEARESWIAQWEKRAVGLAVAIAERVIRRQLSFTPEIPVELVREALRMSSGSQRVRVSMNPVDVEALHTTIRRVFEEAAPSISVELISDTKVSAGGCVVESEHGTIDQQFSAQLARIEEELTWNR